MISESPRSGFALWLTGLPSSGKSTLAEYLGRNLERRGVLVQILDSDQLRDWLTPEPDFTQQERDWFYRALVEIAGLLTDNGVNVVIAATGSRKDYRLLARERIERCVIAHVDCPRAVCRARDSKGLWSRADRGEIKNFPGVDAPFDVPESPQVRVDTAQQSIPEASLELLGYLDSSGFI